MPFRYVINDLSPNFDPVVEDLTRKIEELSEELKSIRMNLRRLKYGNDLQVLKTIDTQLHRLQMTFESSDEYSEMSNFKAKIHAKNVCDEKYLGTTHGYPLYKNGFEIIEKCPEKPKIPDLITILFNFVPYTTNATKIAEIIQEIHEILPNVKIKIATRFPMENLPENVFVMKIRPEFTPGIIWNKLLHDVQTPYVFLALDLLHFDEFINFERMVRIRIWQRLKITKLAK